MGTTSGHLNTPKLVDLVAATAPPPSSTFDNHNYRGAHVCVNITAVAGVTPVLTVYIEGLDPVSGVWYPLLVSAALSVTGFNLLTIYPGVGTVPNTAVSQVLPATWRIRPVVSGVGAAFTATFGACMLK